MDVTIIIPVFNQLSYTQQCLESLAAAGYDESMTVIINNASTDGTPEYLNNRPKLRAIHNQQNRACAAAWNQGFQASQTCWTFFLNNDVVVPRGCLESLIHFAETNQVDIASPAMGEGELSYDLAGYAREFTAVMNPIQRRGAAYGAAFAVARKVFESIGSFDENFRKAGFEDDDFFRRAGRAGFKLAITGSAYLHHFSNVTQRTVVAEGGPYRSEGVAYFRAKWKLNWLKRRWQRLRRKTVERYWRWNERWRFGHTLHEQRVNGKILYR